MLPGAGCHDLKSAYDSVVQSRAFLASSYVPSRFGGVCTRVRAHNHPFVDDGKLTKLT
jgi:hypothetical protein